MSTEEIKKKFFLAATLAAFAMTAVCCSLNAAGTAASVADAPDGVEIPELETPEPELSISDPSPDPDPAPASITSAVYNETKEDISAFIKNLNSIIRARKYNEWRTYLDDDYYNFINSPDYLQTVSNSKVLRTKKIVLTSAYDYFINVVVPARSNDRVDDIEFTNANRVKAITVYDGRRMILHDLEKRPDGWKIVSPN